LSWESEREGEGERETLGFLLEKREGPVREGKGTGFRVLLWGREKGVS